MRDDFPGASEHCEYVHLDVTQGETVEAVKEMIVARHDTLDILINNAGRYEVPDTSAPPSSGSRPTSSWAPTTGASSGWWRGCGAC